MIEKKLNTKIHYKSVLVNSVLLTKMIPEDNAYLGKLIDPDGNKLQDTFFCIDKHPFDELTSSEKEYLQGKSPNKLWSKELIKIWMNDHGANTEDSISILDYEDSDTKEILLIKVDEFLNVNQTLLFDY